ncbi:putative glycoside hydrolase, family 79 [Helianthus annuus]|nr:putative glycoside hydrolase, family 79 [Helianthus annuus]
MKVLFGFSNSHLSIERRDELNYFFFLQREVVTFRLNALHGRHQFKR